MSTRGERWAYLVGSAYLLGFRFFLGWLERGSEGSLIIAGVRVRLAARDVLGLMSLLESLESDVDSY